MNWTTNASPHPPSPTGVSTSARAVRCTASGSAIEGLPARASTPLLFCRRPHHLQHRGRTVALSPAFLDLLFAQTANTAQQNVRGQRVAQAVPLRHFDERGQSALAQQTKR